MPTPIKIIESAFSAAISTSMGLQTPALVTASGQPQLADYQCNAAMSLAKQLSASGEKTNPRAIAEKLKAAVQPLLTGIIEGEVTVAGPGFLNIRLSPTWIATQLVTALKDPQLGIDKTATPQRMVIDMCGVNAAKEMHVGHLRPSIIPDAVANVMETLGHTIIRQNHIGDWGTQFGMLLAHLKSIPDAEAEQITSLDGFYRDAKKKFDADPAFADASRQMVVTLQGGDPETLRLWNRIMDATRDHYESVCRRLGVNMTRADERGESTYNADLPRVVEDLKAAGLAVLSDGATVVFIDGPDKTPLIVQKTGGGFGYGATDLAAVRYRAQVLKGDRLLYFVDSRQIHHLGQVFSTARAAGWLGHATTEHAYFGTVMGADNKPFKTRSGDVVKLADLLEEAAERAMAVVKEKNMDLPEAHQRDVARAVGIGAIKYADLSKDRTSDYVFDWDRMLALQGNTAPYLQYAYTRVKSIFRKSGINPQALTGTITLTEPTEITLGKFLLRYGETLEAVALELKPHLLCNYLYELAGKFSAFYEACPVLNAEDSIKTSRLLLAYSTSQTLKAGLTLLGIECPEEM